MKTRILVDSICQQALSTFLKSLIAMQCMIRPGIKFDFWKMDLFSEFFECLFLKSLIAMQGNASVVSKSRCKRVRLLNNNPMP